MTDYVRVTVKWSEEDPRCGVLPFEVDLQICDIVQDRERYTYMGKFVLTPARREGFKPDEPTEPEPGQLFDFDPYQ